MEIEIFFNLMLEREIITSQLVLIDAKINNMINEINKEVGREVFNTIEDVFSIENIDCFGKSEKYVIGNYIESTGIISYDLDITDYLLRKYKNEFKKLINRKNKHKISFVLEYNIETKFFNISLIHHGILYAGLIREETLRKATGDILRVAKGVFDANGIELEDIPSRFLMVRDIFDDYDGYFVTSLLCEKQ